MQVQSLGWEDPLEEDMATHSSSLAWRILWTEEPGGLRTTGSKESDMAELTLHAQAMYKSLYYKLYPNTFSETTSCQSGNFSPEIILRTQEFFTVFTNTSEHSPAKEMCDMKASSASQEKTDTHAAFAQKEESY